MIQEQNIELIDLKFVDPRYLATPHGIRIKLTKITDRVPFDGSSIRGWKSIDRWAAA